MLALKVGQFYNDFKLKFVPEDRGRRRDSLVRELRMGKPDRFCGICAIIQRTPKKARGLAKRAENEPKFIRWPDSLINLFELTVTEPGSEHGECSLLEESTP